jgi:putative 4-mercaptohistidine N1-methyltranferase
MAGRDSVEPSTLVSSFYETNRVVAEYLLFHYGSAEHILPYAFGPITALHFAVRCITECLDAGRLPAPARALDLGCAVGRSSFELARHCDEVLGIDYSTRFVETASHLQKQGSFTYAHLDEGLLSIPATAIVPPDIDRQRVRFENGDAQNLRADLGMFDVVLMANLIDRLARPRLCLQRLPALVGPGGQLIITSPYTWLSEFTPPENWLGGFVRGANRIKTLDTLKGLLAPDFDFVRCQDLPFLIREHARKFQWSVAEATLWVRKHN